MCGRHIQQIAYFHRQAVPLQKVNQPKDFFDLTRGAAGDILRVR